MNHYILLFILINKSNNRYDLIRKLCPIIEYLFWSNRLKSYVSSFKLSHRWNTDWFTTTICYQSCFQAVEQQIDWCQFMSILRKVKSNYLSISHQILNVIRLLIIQLYTMITFLIEDLLSCYYIEEDFLNSDKIFWYSQFIYILW